MTYDFFINEANYVFHPTKLTVFQRIFWIVLGLLLVCLTVGIVPTLCYSVFFTRSEYLNKKKMYELLKKHPKIIPHPVKVRQGILTGYMWSLDMRTDICWTEMGVFATLNVSDKDGEIIFSTVVSDRVQRRLDNELKELLKASMKSKNRQYENSLHG